MPHEFLSDAWFRAVESLGPPPPWPGPEPGAVNIVVTRPDAPDVEIHLAAGRLGPGLLEEASLTLRTTYDVARSVLLEGSQHAAMHAFITGQVRAQGDMSPLMTIGRTPRSPESKTYARSVLALTEP